MQTPGIRRAFVFITIKYILINLDKKTNEKPQKHNISGVLLFWETGDQDFFTLNTIYSFPSSI